MGGKGMQKRCFRLVLHISLIELLSDSITAPRLFASCRQCSHIPVRLKTRCKAQSRRRLPATYKSLNCRKYINVMISPPQLLPNPLQSLT